MLISGQTYKLTECSFTHVYKYLEENPTGPKRKLKETIQHMEEAFSSNSTVSVHFIHWMKKWYNFKLLITDMWI